MNVKGLQIEKAVLLPLSAANIIINTEKIKDSTRKLTETINQFSKVPDYKINTQKSVDFPYANNEKEEINKTISFTKKTIKHS